MEYIGTSALWPTHMTLHAVWLTSALRCCPLITPDITAVSSHLFHLWHYILRAHDTSALWPTHMTLHAVWLASAPCCCPLITPYITVVSSHQLHLWHYIQQLMISLHFGPLITHGITYDFTHCLRNFCCCPLISLHHSCCLSPPSLMTWHPSSWWYLMTPRCFLLVLLHSWFLLMTMGKNSINHNMSLQGN